MAFNTVCIESQQKFYKLISSPSRGPLLGCQRNPTVSATKKRKAEDKSPPPTATCLTDSLPASTQDFIEYIEERNYKEMEDVFDDHEDVDVDDIGKLPTLAD